MEPFSYLVVLVSLVLALGITRILTGVGQLLQYRERMAVSGVHLLWTAVLFIVHVQYWWSLYSLRDLPDWTFIGFIAALIPPALLYLMAVVLFPERMEEGADLERHYFDGRRAFFLLFALAVVSSLLVSVAVRPEAFVENLPLYAANIGLVSLLGGIAVWTRSPIYHVLFGLFVGGAILVSTFLGAGLTGGG